MFRMIAVLSLAGIIVTNPIPCIVLGGIIILPKFLKKGE